MATGAEQFAAAAGAFEHVQEKVPTLFVTADAVQKEHSAPHEGADMVAAPLAVQQEGWTHELPFQVLHAAHTNPHASAQYESAGTAEGVHDSPFHVCSNRPVPAAPDGTQLQVHGTCLFAPVSRQVAAPTLATLSCAKRLASVLHARTVVKAFLQNSASSHSQAAGSGRIFETAVPLYAVASAAERELHHSGSVG